MSVVKILCFLFIIPILSFGQDVRKIKIEAKTVNIKGSFIFVITKTDNDIKVVYKSVDSIGQLNFSEKDLTTLKNIKTRTTRFLENLSADSIAFYQHQLDSLIGLKIFYKSDSTTVYQTTHNNYWKLVETIFKTPDVVLEKKTGTRGTINTIYLFTLQYGVANMDRRIQIDSDNEKDYPLLGKLLRDSDAIIKAHQKVMGRRNH
jgi:hypothetical protein